MIHSHILLHLLHIIEEPRRRNFVGIFFLSFNYDVSHVLVGTIECARKQLCLLQMCIIHVDLCLFCNRRYLLPSYFISSILFNSCLPSEFKMQFAIFSMSTCSISVILLGGFNKFGQPCQCLFLLILLFSFIY